jgi:hypothetical protein
MLVWNLVCFVLLPYFGPNLEISMRRILSERNLVVILFVLALVVFVFAHRDTRQMEMLYMDKESSISSLSTAHQPFTEVKDASLPETAAVLIR